MALGNFRARANSTQRTTRALITSSVIPVESTKKTMKVDLRVNEDLWRTFVEDCQRKASRRHPSCAALWKSKSAKLKNLDTHVRVRTIVRTRILIYGKKGGEDGLLTA